MFSLLLVLMLSTGCKKNDGASNSINTQEVSANVVTGKWQVIYCFHNGQTLTSSFSGYIFTFNSNGTVTAVNGIISPSGTWSVENDSGTIKLKLNFTSPSNFQEISEDWRVTLNTATQIKLTNVSSSGSADQLIFEKV